MVSKDYEQRIIEETKQIVGVFLKTNASDVELGTMTGFSSSTVGRRLTNKERIIKAFSDRGEEIYQTIMAKRSENSKQGKLLGGQVSMLNYGTSNQGAKQKVLPKLRLEIFSKSEEKQIKFLIHMALTYRVRLPLLSELFQKDEKELLELILKYVGSSYRAILYLFYHDSSNQEVALNNVIIFYRNLVNSIKNKDKDLQGLVIAQIDDSKACALIKGKNHGDKLSLEALEIILRYQLKYALTQNEVACIFDIDKRNYRRRIDELLHSDQSLNSRFCSLSSFNEQSEYYSGRK